MAVKKRVNPTLLSMCVSTHRRQPNNDAVQALVGNHLAAQAAGACQPKGKVQHVVLIVTRLLCGGVTPITSACPSVIMRSIGLQCPVHPSSAEAPHLEACVELGAFNDDVTCAACERPFTRALT